MGEIADMMLDGTLCQGCGAYMDDSEPGHPRFCHSCRREQRESMSPRFPAPSNPAKVACEVCGRHVKATGLKDHMRDRHGSPPTHPRSPSE